MDAATPSTALSKASLDDTMRRRSIGFINWAHALDHYVILIFPTVVIGLEAVYGRSYGDLIALSTAAFTAFGLFALPSGWLADRWSRRNMIAVYYFGTGICAAAVGLSQSFTTLAIALFGVGLFAAIYHPVGTPMLIDQAIVRGRSVALNGICGNMGVSIASGATAAISSWIGWRFAFFIPAVVFVVSGVVYLIAVPDGGRKRVVQAPAQDVALAKGLAIAVNALFMLLALGTGLVFNAVTITLPKLVEQRMGEGISLTVVGALATAVFLCGGLAQFSMGRAVERIAPHALVSLVAVGQFVGVVWAMVASGWFLLPALALAVAAIYAQVTVNDLVLARYTPAAWRGRIYAFRFFLIFTSAGPAVWGIAWLHARGGFDLVLTVTAIVAAVFAVNSFAITALVSGAESQRAKAIAQPAE